jgi:TolB-like protein
VRVYRLNFAEQAASASPAPRTRTLEEKPSIAVLAFNNMSGDPEQEYFSDGICEDIITDLSKLSELHVIARNSSFTYKGKPVDVKQVGRELGVRYVLEGSVRKAGNRVRVTGQLIDAASGAHIWAERFDRDLTDIFAVQDELTQEIIAALKIKLSAPEKMRIAGSGTKNVDAHDFFLRGRELVIGNKRDRAMFAPRRTTISAAPSSLIRISRARTQLSPGPTSWTIRTDGATAPKRHWTTPNVLSRRQSKKTKAIHSCTMSLRCLPCGRRITSDGLTRQTRRYRLIQTTETRTLLAAWCMSIRESR